MEKELQFLEVKQRELEMDGVVMEKRLRECVEGKLLSYVKAPPTPPTTGYTP